MHIEEVNNISMCVFAITFCTPKKTTTKRTTTQRKIQT